MVYSYLNAGITKSILSSMDTRLCVEFKRSEFEFLTILTCDFVLLSVFVSSFFVVVGVYLNSYVHQTHPLHIVITF